MTEYALILAAHGSRVDDSSNAALWKMADAVRAGSDMAEVTCAFHHGAPSFADVLGTVRSRRVVVSPIMTSEGYYSRVALPRALASHADFPNRTVRITRPIGVHSAIPTLMQRRLENLLEQFKLPAAATSVAVIGHGTPRHADSKIATNELANSLRRLGPCDDVFPAFLDEEPFVESVPQRARHDVIVSLLFLIAAGPHALEDVPRRLGMTKTQKFTPPLFERVGERIVVVDEAVGTDPAIISLVISLANRAVEEMASDELPPEPRNARATPQPRVLN